MQTIFTLLLFTFCCNFTYAQSVLECSDRDQHSIYYLSPGNGIYRIDSVDTSPTEPIQVLGEPIGGADGLSINRILDTVPNPLTLYCTSNGYYHYWAQNQWVNTNHLAGGYSGNVGGTDSFIFCFVPAAGAVYRYDGTADAVQLVNLPINGSATAFDVATDRLGNFYIFFTDSNRIVVYDPNAVPIDTFTVSGHAIGAQGGLALLNSRMYLVKLNSIYEGIIVGHHITFSLIKTYITNLGIVDIAACPEAAQPMGIWQQSLAPLTKIYPNPVVDKLNVDVNSSAFSEIILYDFLGQQVLQQTFTNSTTINTEQLADGIYFYELRNSMGTLKTGKVVKQ